MTVRTAEIGRNIRITVTLDEALVAKAQELSGINGRSALLREALIALIQRQGAMRLASMGGAEPKLVAVERRRR